MDLYTQESVAALRIWRFCRNMKKVTVHFETGILIIRKREKINKKDAQAY